MKNKLVLDVDGVILDFGAKYIEIAREVLKYDINPNLSRYELKDLLQVNESENQKVWEEFIHRNAWNSIPALNNSEEAIKKINALNIEVYIVTSVDPIYRRARLESLKNIGLQPKAIFCVGDGRLTGIHKDEIVSAIQPFAFVDDRLDHLFRSQDIEHLAWVNNNHNQAIPKFDKISAEVNSLNQWVDLYLPNLLNNNNNNNKIKLK